MGNQEKKDKNLLSGKNGDGDESNEDAVDERKRESIGRGEGNTRRISFYRKRAPGTNRDRHWMLRTKQIDEKRQDVQVSRAGAKVGLTKVTVALPRLSKGAQKSTH